MLTAYQFVLQLFFGWYFSLVMPFGSSFAIQKNVCIEHSAMNLEVVGRFNWWMGCDEYTCLNKEHLNSISLDWFGVTRNPNDIALTNKFTNKRASAAAHAERFSELAVKMW